MGFKTQKMIIFKFIRFRLQSLIDLLISIPKLMSAEIQKLIANIQHKFDEEFNDKPDPTSLSESKPNQNSSNQQMINPQSQGQKLKGQNHQNEQTNTLSVEVQQQSHQPQETKVKKSEITPKKQMKQKKQEINEGKEQNIYKSLSTKLESALKKITTEKKDFKTLSKNSTMGILHRFSEHERRKEKQLADKRVIEEEKKYFGMKQKPDIDPNSRKIAQQTSYKPIYQRFQHILQEKKKKFEQNESNKKAKEQEQYEKFLEEYQSHVKVQPEKCRNAQTYFQDMMTWKKKLDKVKQDKLKQKKEKETQGYTFKPELNKKSMRMVKQANRVPIQQRQIFRYHTEPDFSFQPKTNKRILK